MKREEGYTEYMPTSDESFAAENEVYSAAFNSEIAAEYGL